MFAKAKITPNDIQVIELHDCFSANELLTYEVRFPIVGSNSGFHTLSRLFLFVLLVKLDNWWIVVTLLMVENGYFF